MTFSERRPSVKIAGGLFICSIQSPYRIEIVLPSDRRITVPTPAVVPHTNGTASRAVRLHYLDGLRVLAILTVFVYHSTRFFNMEDWHVKNPIRTSSFR